MDGMKRYSIVPSSSKRKSTISMNDEDLGPLKVELEKLEQETTLILQEIDKNISKSNSIINDKLIPVIKQYSVESKKIWMNTGFWKGFFEQSANVEINTFEEPITNDNLQPGNLLLNDEDEEEVDTSNLLPSNDDKLLQLPQFKKPVGKPHIEESTPTWSTQATTNKQFQSSTPQLNKGPSLLPGFHRHDSKFDSNDSIGMQPPPLLTTNITQTTTKSPAKIQTIRQSLDTYQRVSISPKKARLNDHGGRRSSIIENLLSSPTLPEPPVLQSELAQQSSDNADQDELGRLSPVILPPELSPYKKNILPIQENHMQRFPSTPKFAGRISDGSVAVMKTPLGMKFAGDDSDLAPPQLQNDPDLKQTNVEEEDDVPFPDLQTIDLQNRPYANKRQTDELEEDEANKRSRIVANEADNVFLDHTNKSIGSTVYHSIMNQDKDKDTDKEKDKTNLSNNEVTHNQSKSLSHIFDEAINNLNPATNSENKNLPEPANLFTEFTNEDHSNSNHDTESFTSDMGSILGERYKNLFGKK